MKFAQNFQRISIQNLPDFIHARRGQKSPRLRGKDERMVSMHKFRFLVDKGRGDALKSRKGCDGEDVRHPRFRDAAVGASRGKGPKVGRSRAGRKKGPVPQ